jgi:hypothetical protein
VLGLSVVEDWRDARPLAGSSVASAAPGGRQSPWRPPAGRENWLAARREDARWAREYLAPWASRRLHGVSSGDGRAAKRPQLTPVSPPVLM